MGCVSIVRDSLAPEVDRLLAADLYIYNAKLSKKVESAKFFLYFLNMLFNIYPAAAVAALGCFN